MKKNIGNSFNYSAVGRESWHWDNKTSTARVNGEVNIQIEMDWRFAEKRTRPFVSIFRPNRIASRFLTI